MSADDHSLRADARRNRDRLITVAREAFNDHGIGAPLDDIARRAAVGPGTLYRHFPTREALMLAVYRRDVELIAERATVLAAEYPPLEALTLWVREQLVYISHRQGLGAAIKKMMGTDSETLEWCKVTMRAAANTLLVRAQEAGQIRPDADGTMMLRLVHAVGVASETAPEQADTMISIVLSGLRTPDN